MVSFKPLLQIDNLLVKFGAVLWVSVLLGTLIPGLVATRHDVFYSRDLEHQIVARGISPAAKILKRSEAFTARLEVLNSEIASDLTSSQTPADLSSLLQSREQLRAERERVNTQIVLGPFFLNDLMVAWSTMYIALGTLLFVLSPEVRGARSAGGWKALTAILAIYPLYQGPVWLRNFVLNNDQRRVFSFANYDICPAGFWMQEVNTLIWLVAVTFLWRSWLLIYRQRSSEVSQHARKPVGLDDLTRLSNTFVHWQASSVVLALGFMTFTGVFWNLVIVDKDRRYLVPAIVVHVLWAISWLLMSLPLLTTWQDFSRKKARAILGQIGCENDSESNPINADLVDKLSPIALWNGFGSAATALVSFIFPIIHAMAK